MESDLYIDCEWFLKGDIFLIGWARSINVYGQLYDDALTRENFVKLLKATKGIIYIYGPDIGRLETFFEMDIRSHWHCVNLNKVFKDHLPNLPNYELATIEKLYNLQRKRKEYKANIFEIFKDWRNPQRRSLTLQYNQEDVLNLLLLKQIIFHQYHIDVNYLHQVRLSGVCEVNHSYVCILPADVYRGPCGKRSVNGECIQDPNITAQMVIGAKFYNDKVSLHRMGVLMWEVARRHEFDLVTCVNNRDTPFHIAKALAIDIASRLKVPFFEAIYNSNTSCRSMVKGKKLLIVDDVLYKGRTMNAAVNAAKSQHPASIHFLVFGKSARNAW